MKFVIQRVNWASVACFDDKLNIIHNDNIQKGLLIFVGINKNDIKNEDKINKAINKILNLPLFDNEEGKIKLSLNDINGEILIIPNFTLEGKNQKGNSIDYTNAAPFKEAKTIYEKFLNLLKKSYQQKVAHGIFGSYMKIQSEIDGPVNFVLQI